MAKKTVRQQAVESYQKRIKDPCVRSLHVKHYEHFVHDVLAPIYRKNWENADFAGDAWPYHDFLWIMATTHKAAGEYARKADLHCENHMHEHLNSIFEELITITIQDYPDIKQRGMSKEQRQEFIQRMDNAKVTMPRTLQKPIRVVSESEFYVTHMKRIVPGVKMLWATANCDFIPVEVISGMQNLTVKDISTGADRGKELGIYIEQIREIEFDDEIIRVNLPLTSPRRQ